MISAWVQNVLPVLIMPRNRYMSHFPFICLHEYIIDNALLISETKRHFYKKFIQLRKEVILDYAYECCVSHRFDEEALNRIQNGEQYTEQLLLKKMT